MSTTGGAVPDRAPIGESGRAPGPGSSGPGAAEVGGHARTGHLRSIRLRLLLPIVVATAGLVVLGVVQTRFAVNTALDARRAQVMADTATATVRLAYRVEQEIAEADALRARGGTSGAVLVAAAQSQTDLAAARFRTVAAKARTGAPALAQVLQQAQTQIDQLPAIRDAVRNLKAGQLSGDRYTELSQNLIAVADALPTQLSDAQLASTARAVGAVTAAEHLGALQRDLLSQVFRRGSMTPAEVAQLAQLTGAQDERFAEFTRGASPTELSRYTDLIRGDDVTQATRMRTALLAPHADLANLKVDPDAWYIAQSNTLRHLHDLQLALTASLDVTSRDRQLRAETSSMLTGTATALLVLLAFSAALLFGVRTSRRLRGLRRAALAIAYAELPTAISTLSRAEEAGDVRTALHDSVTHADKLTVGGADEIGEVGAAVGALHRQALRLAAEQALLRLDVAGLFVALSRRGQTLIHRQIQLIDEFERTETDGARLDRILQLDHLAARMRRNEENLLVLAGGEPGRRVTAPVPLEELIQLAISEIEDYDRVDAVAVADVGIAAHVVRDLIHLLAELLENATTYSPPDTRVRVTARHGAEGLTLAIYDDGIGLAPEDLAEANHRLASQADLTASLAGTMGLLVVARLAARHGVRVQLRSQPGAGTAALVRLPDQLLEVLAPALRPAAARAAVHGPVPEPARGVVPLAQAVIYEELTSAWFQTVPSGQSGSGGWTSPGDHERERVASVLADESYQTTRTGLPRRRAGSRLMPGSVAAAGDAPPVRVDPERVRTRLAGLGRAVIAVDRDGR
jgi:signal transduction histidine kinase